MEKKIKKPQALVIQTVELQEDKRQALQIPTPPEFVKTRPGKGGKEFRYVEVGYVIARMNQVFGPAWEFKVVETKIEPKEVACLVRVTVKDFKTGFTIEKEQWGGHPRYPEVPLADTLKAATSDGLKKACSLFGIALDVYWQVLDDDAKKEVKVAEPKPTKSAVKEATGGKSIFELSMEKINAEHNPQILTEWSTKIVASTRYTGKEKVELVKRIKEKTEGHGKTK